MPKTCDPKARLLFMLETITRKHVLLSGALTRKPDVTASHMWVMRQTMLASPSSVLEIVPTWV